jgi:hypothetical protein
VLELGVGGPRVADRDLHRLADRTPPPALIERDVGGDREHPGSELAPVLEPPVRPKGSEEGLLEGVLGRLAPQQAREVAEDLVLALLVEALEGRNRHGLHHLV